MQRNCRQPRALSRLACLFLLTALAQQAALAQRRPVASVTKVAGDLLVQRKGTVGFRALPLRGTLYEGDIVGTGPGGRAEILFSNGTRVKLDRRSAIEVLADPGYQNKQSLFRAISGMIWSKLRPGQRIKAPPANIVVPGTEILLAVGEDGATTVTVVEGLIVFFNEQGTVEVGGEQQSTARVGEAPTPPVAVDVSGLMAWIADVAGLPLEFEAPFVSPDPAALRPLRAEREATVRTAIGRAPLYQGLGEVLHDLSEYEAAASAFETAARLDPASAPAYAGLGQSKRGQGDTRGAVAAFERSLQIEPENPIARVGLGLTYLAQGDTRRARAAFEAAGQRAPARTGLALLDLQDGRAIDAAAKLQEAIALDARMYQAHALLALAHLTLNRVAPAEQSAREAARLQPNSAQTQGTLGMVLFFAGRPEEATRAAERAVRLNPLSPFALLTRGRALLSRQRTDEARTAYERAASLAPDLWLAHTELGAVYLRLGMIPRAAAAYRRALELNPNSPDAHTGLAVALQRQGQGAGAEAAHRRALELAPNHTTARGNLAALYIEQGRLDQARAELEQGVEAQPERGILYARLAEISLYRQDLLAAQEFARRGVRLLPDSAFAHYQLGRVYLEQERLVQAEQEFRLAATLDRQFAEARFALGLTRERTEAGILPPFGGLTPEPGSAGATLSLENLQTPGAEERIQAAVQSPTVVRIASRSYGNGELDTRFGGQGTRDFAFSHLQETGDRRGVRGLNAERQETDGVRTNAGETFERFSGVFGQTAQANASGVFALAEYEEQESGLNTLREGDPLLEVLRSRVTFPRFLIGGNVTSGEGSRSRLLVQYSKPRQTIGNPNDPNDRQEFDFDSLNAEYRLDAQIGRNHLLSAGFSAGTRRLDLDIVLPPLFPGDSRFRSASTTQVRAYQAYLRDDVRVSDRLTLTGEMQVQQINRKVTARSLGPEPLPEDTISQVKTFGLPTLVLVYRPDVRTGVRLRARREFGTIRDFQLLAPTDVFLFSTTGLPAPPLLEAAMRYDLEYDHTFGDASLLRLGLFYQDLRNTSDVSGNGVRDAHVRGFRAAYEGTLGRETTYFTSLNVNDTRGTYEITDLTTFESTPLAQSVADVPRWTGEVGIQYLDRNGWFVQPSFFYLGERVGVRAEPVGDPPRSGGFGLVNLRAGRRWGLRSTLFVEVANAFDKTYAIEGRLQPGRELRLGLRQRF